MFAVALGIKVDVVRKLCSRLDKVSGPLIITQSRLDHYLSNNIEFHHDCKLSRAAFQQELVQLKKINRMADNFETNDTEKIHILNDGFISFIKSSDNSYSAISILLQKESFLS